MINIFYSNLRIDLYPTNQIDRSSFRSARYALTVKLTQYIHLHTFHLHSKSPDLDANDEPDAVDKPRVCEPDKHSQVLWCKSDALPDDIIPYVEQALKMIEQGISYSEFGWR